MMKGWITIFLKAILWTALGFVGLMILLIGLLQIPKVQNKLTSKAISFLESKIGSEVRLDRINVVFPKSILLENLFLEDQERDTLLYAQSLTVDMDMLALLHNEIEINYVGLDRLVANIRREQADSSFNFNYIINAFSDTADVEKNNPSENSWAFDIKNVVFEHSRLRYRDQIGQMDAELNIGKLKIRTELFQVDSMKLLFDDILLEKTSAKLIMTGGKENESESDNKIPDIRFEDLQLHKVNFIIHDTVSNQNFSLYIGDAAFEADEMNLTKHHISLDKVSISNSNAALEREHHNSRQQESASSPPTFSVGWDIETDVLDLNSIGLVLNLNNAPIKSNAIDPQHLRLDNFSSKIENFELNDNGVQMNINAMTFTERSGFELDQLVANIAISEHSASIADVSLQTNGSNLTLDLRTEYADLESAFNEPDKMKFELSIAEASISLYDIRFLSPAFYNKVSASLTDTTIINLKSFVNGQMNDFRISDLALSVGSDTRFEMNGKVAGLPEIDQLNFDAEARLTTSRDFLNTILADTFLQSVQLPEKIELISSLVGGISDFKTKLDLKTSIGKIFANAELQDIMSSSPAYRGTINAQKVDLGELFNDTTKFGELTFHLAGEGSGFTYGEMNGEFDVEIDSLEYNNYLYKNLKLFNQMSDQTVTFYSDYTDPNLEFDLEGTIDLKKPDKVFDINFNLARAYLRNLHLSEREFKMQARLTTDIAVGSLRRINGNVHIRDFAIYYNDELYRVDSFLVASVNQDQKTTLNLDSDIIEAEFSGNMSILDLGKTVKQHFNNYFNVSSDAGLTANNQKFEFYVDLKNTDLITEVLFPKVNKFNPGKIKGIYNSAEKKLDFFLNVPMVGYGKAVLDSLVLNVSSNAEKLTYNLTINEIKDSIFHLNQLAFNGEIKNDTLVSSIILLDTISKEKYRLGGLLSRRDEDFVFNFSNDGLIFNYKKWRLPDDHYLQFGKNGFTAWNFKMSSENQSLSLNTERKDLRIKFDQFNLEALSGLIEGRKRILRGELNGELLLVDTLDFTSISADLAFRNVKLRDALIGKIDIKITNRQKERYDGRVWLSGSKNQLAIDGYYDGSTDDSNMNLDANIEKLSLETIELFTGQSIRNSSGYLTGNTTLSGTMVQPEINGKLIFQDASFEIEYLGTTVHINDQSIDFNNELVILDNFIIWDKDDQPFRLDGSVDISHISNPVIDLEVNSNNFLALNTTREDNDQYYGKLVLDGQTTLDGPLDELKISMNLTVGEDSHLTYVAPASQKGPMERKEIIRFVDKDREKDEFLSAIMDQQTDDTHKAPLGLDINAIININRSSMFEIIIDPLAGDKLQLQGDANLSLGINPSGDISLTGQYEIDDGMYIFSFYGLVKKEFDVKKGSVLTWYGNVLDAEVDVKATYDVEAAPVGLMQSQIAENSESSMYNQKLPFIVQLSMQGKLLKPDISFLIDIDDKAKSYAGGAVYGKIQSINQTESEVNKQVFALMLLNRFMADNAFASAGGTTEGFVRTSVSKLLSDQLNKWTDQIDGLDMNVGLKSYEDYSESDRQGRTDLNLGLSKDFLNDRMTVKVAGNITLEGAQQEQKDLSDIAGDVSLEYKLTEDGRFRIVTFRKEVYEALLQGEIIETGAGFIIVENFDKLSELLQKNKKQKEGTDE